MRSILIIITLLGAIIAAYALTADFHLEYGLSEILQAVYHGSQSTIVLPKEVTNQYEATILNCRRDSFIICGIGCCMFVLGFIGLIIDRKRKLISKQPTTLPF
jgi:hypothetical protein